ncbi:ethanolamine ammonia-lyase reactivating factor EutA [Roseibium marinum]|nr:ethanolamine ammonia-lyase reactivating factor EutA [Roseibium marinum]
MQFTNAARNLIEEDEIELTSVGVDIGSSTSHLMFSKIVLERRDANYVVSRREVLFESDIMLTPYAAGQTIDASALGAFIEAQYRSAGFAFEDIDAGALILTGVAVRRANARAIAELFAAEAGKFVAVSAGDALETLMAAQGSGAAALSGKGERIVNIDVGGGTTKIALCDAGRVIGRTVVEVGARLVAYDRDGCIVRLEPFGARHLADAGIDARVGSRLTSEQRERVAGKMADRVFSALMGEDLGDLLRMPQLDRPLDKTSVVFSGGVSEFISKDGEATSDDLGPELAVALKKRIGAWAHSILPARQGIRATVVGASQYTVQVSGSTIFLDPPTALPLRNMPVIAPDLDLGEDIDAQAVTRAVEEALLRMGQETGSQPVAVALPWKGSATYVRLSAVARGLVRGLRRHLDEGHPLVLVIEGDVGGLLGMQCRAEETVPGAIVSLDGIGLSEFDFIDVGEVIRATGAAPVVVKSLVFPSE